MVSGKIMAPAEHSSREIFSRLNDGIAELCDRLLADRPVFSSSRTERRYGTHGSLSVIVAGRKRGKWFDHSANVGGSAFKLIKHALGCTGDEAWKYAHDFLGIPRADSSNRRKEPAYRGVEPIVTIGETVPPAITIEPAEPGSTPDETAPDFDPEAERDDQNHVKRRADADRLFNAASPVRAGDPVSRYLRGRGITASVTDDQRFAPELAYWEPDGEDDQGKPRFKFFGRFPGMICAVRNRAGEIIGVHRTYLTDDATKAPVPMPKKSKGPIGGGAVSLTSVRSATIAVSEGIESGASVASVLPDLDVRAALSTSGLIGFEIPDDCRELVILADADEPGRAAADQLAARAFAAGIKVRIALPPPRSKGYDFNDLLKDDGPDAVRAAVERAPEWSPPPPTYPRNEVPPTEARARVQEEIGRFVKVETREFHTARSAWLKACDEAEERHNIEFQEWERQFNEALAEGRYWVYPPPERLPSPAPRLPVLAVKVDPGLGKTHAALSAAAEFLHGLRLDGDKRQVVMFVPRHELGDQHAQAFLKEAEKHGLKAAVYRSRKADDRDEPGKKMCLELDFVKAVESVGGNLDKIACGSRKLGDPHCPKYRQCGYQRMRKHLRDADLVIMPHQMMHLGAPVKGLDPALVIVDESFWPANTKGHRAKDAEHLPIENISRPRPVWTVDENDRLKIDPAGTADLAAISMKLARALKDHPAGALQRAAIDDTRLTERDCRTALKLEGRAIVRLPADLRRMPKSEQERWIADAQYNPISLTMERIWERVIRLLEDEDRTVSVEVNIDPFHKADDTSGYIKALSLGGREGVRDAYWAPTLILDATLSEPIVRKFFPTMRDAVAIQASMPFAYVRQIHDRTLAPSTLKHEDGARTLERLRRYIELQAKLFEERGRTVLYLENGVDVEARWDVAIFLPRLVLSLLEKDGWVPPANVTFGTFRALNGINRWAGVAKLIVISRIQAPVRQIEDLASVLQGLPVWQLPRRKAENEPDDTPGPLPKIDRTIGLANSLATRVQGAFHPDAMAEEVRWQITEAELVQAIGRGRGVNRTASDPLAIDILTDVAVPICVNETCRLADVLPGPFTEMALAGVLPQSPADCVKLFPSQFKSLKAAARAIEEVRKYPQSPIYNNNRSLGVFSPLLSERDFGAGAELIHAKLARSDLPDAAMHARGRMLVTHIVRYRLPGQRGQAKTVLYRPDAVGGDIARWLAEKHGVETISIEGEPEMIAPHVVEPAPKDEPIDIRPRKPAALNIHQLLKMLGVDRDSFKSICSKRGVDEMRPSKERMRAEIECASIALARSIGVERARLRVAEVLAIYPSDLG